MAAAMTQVMSTVMGNKGAFVGAGASAVSGILEGNMARRSAGMEADQMAQKAKSAFAKGTVDAAEQRRQARVTKSDARAAMAGSGTVTDDAQAISQLAEIEQVGEFNAMSALFGARTEQQSLLRAERMKRYEGESSRTANMFKGLGTVVSTYVDNSTKTKTKSKARGVPMSKPTVSYT
jgi:hypothetical protein